MTIPPHSTTRSDRSGLRWRSRPGALALAAAIVTAGGVSWCTPDGNLVVTGVPALAVGLGVFGLLRWRLRRSRST